ncbi:hypothetical protein ACJX0J_008991 [Zea mays]
MQYKMLLFFILKTFGDCSTALACTSALILCIMTDVGIKISHTVFHVIRYVVQIVVLSVLAAALQFLIESRYEFFVLDLAPLCATLLPHLFNLRMLLAELLMYSESGKQSADSVSIFRGLKTCQIFSFAHLYRILSSFACLHVLQPHDNLLSVFLDSLNHHEVVLLSHVL